MREVNEAKVRAILVSDVHLQARPPIARSTEPDWFAAMQRPLDQIATLAKGHKCPVLYAGDIFDKWNVGPEVINFALRHLPKGYAVPGQHDLPNHNYAEMGRSAYGTLVEAGHLINVEGRVRVPHGLAVTGFPWGCAPAPLDVGAWGPPAEFEIALIHRFVWIKGCGYPGADEAAYLSTKALQGYTVAAYGDNHKGFIVKPKHDGDPWVINCGGLMRRKTDERDYQPGMGLLMDDGQVRRWDLDTTADKFIALTAAEEAVAQTLDMTEFVEGLKGLGADGALDFWGAMRRFMDTNGTRQPVRDFILGSMDK